MTTMTESDWLTLQALWNMWLLYFICNHSSNFSVVAWNNTWRQRRKPAVSNMVCTLSSLYMNLSQRTCITSIKIQYEYLRERNVLNAWTFSPVLLNMVFPPICCGQTGFCHLHCFSLSCLKQDICMERSRYFEIKVSYHSQKTDRSCNTLKPVKLALPLQIVATFLSFKFCFWVHSLLYVCTKTGKLLLRQAGLSHLSLFSQSDFCCLVYLPASRIPQNKERND